MTTVPAPTVPATRLRRHTRHHLGQVLSYATVIAWTAVCLAPVVWIVLQSLKPTTDVFAIPPAWIFSPTGDSYAALFAASGAFTGYLLNSLVITAVTLALTLAVSLPAAYALTFLRLRHRFWATLILQATLLPPVVLLVPLYHLWQALGLLDNPVALILTYTALNVPFTVWMLRGFMMQIPHEIFESARVDGAAHVTALVRVMTPLVRSGIAAAAVFIVITSWNELLFAVAFTSQHRTATSGIVATLISDRGMAWGRLYAASMLVVAPILLFTIAVQRHFVRGLTLGAVKG